MTNRLRKDESPENNEHEQDFALFSPLNMERRDCTEMSRLIYDILQKMEENMQKFIENFGLNE